MAKGLLVPDEMVAELIQGRLAKADAKRGAIFDGYPRTVPQAEMLERILTGMGRSIAHVVSLEVPLVHIVDRITGRRVHEPTGQVFHVRYNPPPPGLDPSQLVQRKDDTEEVVQTRHEEYRAKTEPLLRYYGERGLVRPVDGVGDLDVITERVKKAIAATE
jgi:adenylate kinase